MSELKKLEYRVKEKTVWFITRYCEYGDDQMTGVSITEEGEFDDALKAQRAAVALCEHEADETVGRDDPRIIFPDPIKYNGLLPS